MVASVSNKDVLMSHAICTVFRILVGQWQDAPDIVKALRRFQKKIK